MMKKMYILILILIGLTSICFSRGEEELKYYHDRGIRSFRAGKYMTVIDAFNKVIKLNPDLPASYYFRGRSYLHADINIYKDKFKRCSDDLTIYINMTKSSQPEVFYDRGLAFYKQKKYKEALADFNHTKQLDPKIKKLYFNRGLAHYRLQKYKKSIIDFRLYLRYYPKGRPIAYFYIAVNCEILNKPDLAVKNYRIYLQASKNQNPQITAEAKKRIKELTSSGSDESKKPEESVEDEDLEDDEEDELSDDEELD